MTAEPADITNTKIAEYIENGIEYLKTHGWCQGQMYKYATNRPGRIIGACAIGSIVLGNPQEWKYFAQARDELNRDVQLVHHMFRIICFNDIGAKTKEEVIDQMMITVKRLRNS